MSLQLHCKRAKIFQLPGSTEEGKGSLTFAIPAGATAYAPNWVAETLTFKHGIKDKSILDYTPGRTIVVEASAKELEEASKVDEQEQPPAKAKDPSEMTDEELVAANLAERPKANRLPSGIVTPSTGRKK